MSVQPPRITEEEFQRAAHWNLENISEEVFGRVPAKVAHAGFGSLLLLNEERKGFQAWQYAKDLLNISRVTWAVFDYQEVFSLPRDGMLGPKTWASILSRFGRHWVYRGRAEAVQPREGIGDLLSFDESGGLRHLDNHSHRREPISFLGVHWGSYNARALHQYFSTTSRSVSSHFGVDTTGTYQYVDLEKVTWHGTSMNAYSVGGDVCQPVTVDRLEQARANGCDVGIIDNPYWHGDPQVLSLDPRIAWNMRCALEELAEILKLPFRWIDPPPKGRVWTPRELLQRGEKGIICHCDWDLNKWDIGPWRDAVRYAQPPST